MDRKLLAFLLLFASALEVSIGGFCPDAGPIQPCYCHNNNQQVVLMCSNIPRPDVLVTVAQNSQHYKYDRVIIEESKLPYLPRQVPEKIKTKQMVLRNLTLDKLLDRTPNTLDDLQYLVLQNIETNEFTWTGFNNTKGLKSLIIDHVDIPAITKDMTQFLTHEVEALHFRYTGTKEIVAGAFEGFHVLQTLSITHNELETIDRTAFPSPFPVELLFLSYNKLTVIPDDLLTGMPNLKAVFFNQNLISALSEPAFSAASTISHIDIYDNPLKCDCTFMWIAVQKPQNIKGKCAAPKPLRGRELQYLNKDELDC